MFRRILIAALAALVVATAAGCSKSGPTLNLFAWSEYFPDEVLKGFQQETGIKVNYDTYSNNEEMAAKLRAGGSQYDLAVPSTYMVHSLAGQGLLQEIDQSQLTNLKNIGSEFMNLSHDPGNKYSVPYMWGTLGIAYNDKYVPRAPEKWADVLDGAYRNRVVAVDDSRDILGVGLQAVGYSRNETDPAKLKEAQTWLKQLVPNIKAWNSDSPKTLLIDGSAWVGLVWNGDAALAMKENPDIRYVIPKDGGMLWLDSLVIPKGAPNAKLAHQFINYLLKPEVAAKFGTAFPYGLPNTEGYKLLPDSVKQNVASYPPAAWLTKAEYAADIGTKAAAFDQAFTEIKVGK